MADGQAERRGWGTAYSNTAHRDPRSRLFSRARVSADAIPTFRLRLPRSPKDCELTRAAAKLLVDRLDWDGFNAWVLDEIRFGNVLMREAMFLGAAAPKPSVEDILEIDRHFHTWVAAFTSNIRRFRKVGPDSAALTELSNIARGHTTTVLQRNGWPEPADHIPGIVPL